MSTDEADDKRALIRRALIREANVRRMPAEELGMLLDWSDRVLDITAYDQPSFPYGVFNAWKAHHG